MQLKLFQETDATNFNANIENTGDFKYFKYKAKLLENAEAHNGNGNFKKSNNCVLTLADNENNINGDAKASNLIVIITKLYVPVVTLQ